MHSHFGFGLTEPQCWELLPLVQRNFGWDPPRRKSDGTCQFTHHRHEPALFGQWIMLEDKIVRFVELTEEKVLCELVIFVETGL